MIIDFQAHVFPEAYIAEMNRLDGAVILEEPDPHSGMRYFYDKKLGCRINTATFQGQDIEKRLKHMDQLGVDIHVLTIPAPGADRFEGADAIKIARVANDAIAAIARQHPKRFIGFFTLPTCDIKAALDELERSVNDLGLRGFGCFVNLNGQALDREELFPIYERLVQYKLPVYLHPTAPLATEATGIDIMPTLIFGWAFDSTVAMTRLVYGRVLERFPEINWVVADVGGVLAFFAQRAINIYTGRTDEIRHKYGSERKSARFVSAILCRHGRSSGFDAALRERFLQRRTEWSWARIIPMDRKKAACWLKTVSKPSTGSISMQSTKKKFSAATRRGFSE